jgi:hypothetical protein
MSQPSHRKGCFIASPCHSFNLADVDIHMRDPKDFGVAERVASRREDAAKQARFVRSNVT